MTQPSVTINELDGTLGVLPPSGGRLLALAGASSDGPLLLPATYGRVKDLTATFGQGPLVEAAAHAIERWGKAVLVIRTNATVAGAAGTVNDDGVTGTSVVTADATVTPRDDYQVYFIIMGGGTIGTTGITFRYSLDGGRTLSPLTSLGIAVTFTIPDAGVKVDFAVGTLVTGDFFTFTTTAPNWNASELGAALDALALSAVNWEICEIVGTVDGLAFDAIETKFAAMQARGKYRTWIGNTRMPNAGESEAAYLATLSGLFASKASVVGGLCAGATKMTSSVSGRKYRRPVAFVTAARESAMSEEINTADINLGSLTGVSIRDENGNPDEHDESAYPGLDDARFYVLRTHDGVAGVYVNRPRIFSSEGSDFQLVPHRRVMNLAHDALRAYFIRRLNKPILVNSTTGFILESEAREIEKGAEKAMRGALLAKPKASAVRFVLSRVDDLLATKTLTGQARVVPLAYPEFIVLDLGFENPALQVEEV